MAETKRKSRGDGNNRGKAKGKRGPANKKQKKGERKGPRLPNSLRKEIERLNPVDEDIDSDEEAYGGGRDLYEYEEELPEEDSKKNRRFDPVENLEYELPDEFEDENVSSDDDNVHGGGGEDGVEEGGKEDDEGRQGITQIPSEFSGKKKRKMSDVVIAEAYPESEYNPTRDTVDGEGPVSIGDLIDPLRGKDGYNKLRKRTQHLVNKSAPTLVPLSKAEQMRVEVKVTKEETKKKLTKWERLIKTYREAPTLFFDDHMDFGNSTVGEIASQFVPRTGFEKEITALVHDDHVMDAHLKDGSRLLEMNMVSAEDEKDRHNRMAKMRSLLFRHEMKSKHIKKIKSKTYHRLSKKGRLKAASSQSQTDPEASKILAEKKAYERAKERMTLRHKSSSKWAQRKKERGIDKQDEGTRIALAEQQHLHADLTRKQYSVKDGSSSSDDSSDEDDVDFSDGPDHARESKLLEKAMEKTLSVLDEDDEVPKSGVFSLPFMVRGMKKKNEAAAEEAKLAVEEYESWSNKLDDSTGANNPKAGPISGRMVFSASTKEASESCNKTKLDDNIRSDNYYGNSDSEDDLEPKENGDVSKDISCDLHKDVNLSHLFLIEDSEDQRYSLFKNSDDIAQVPGPKTAQDVSVFASGTWKKMNSGNNVDAYAKQSAPPSNSVVVNQNFQEPGKDFNDDSDADSEGQMVDGILSSNPKDVSYYELPSQDELRRQAFAGDDVENDFEKEKQAVLNEENPEPEKPALLPGWGQWTHVQKKKGLPSWMVQQHESDRRKREETLKKRKDASLKRVIISEKPDKKADKLFTQSLPYPFTSQEMYEQSIRMPLGPEFNPATAVGALNRPEVMKIPGVIIRPIEFKEVNPHENAEGRKPSARKQKQKKKKKTESNSNKIVTKVKTRVKN